MNSWDFESVYVGNGPVSSWTIASDFAANGIRAVGWSEGCGGVWVANLPRVSSYTGGTGVFAIGDADGYSVMVLAFDRPTDLQVDIAGSIGASPAFSLFGALDGVDAYAGSWGASWSRGGMTVTMGTVTSVRVVTHGAAVGVPIDAYREVPAPGAAALILIAAAFAARRRA